MIRKRNIVFATLGAMGLLGLQGCELLLAGGGAVYKGTSCRLNRKRRGLCRNWTGWGFGRFSAAMRQAKFAAHARTSQLLQRHLNGEGLVGGERGIRTLGTGSPLFHLVWRGKWPGFSARNYHHSVERMFASSSPKKLSCAAWTVIRNSGSRREDQREGSTDLRR